MKDYGFIFIFFGGLFVLAIATSGGHGLFSSFTSSSSNPLQHSSNNVSSPAPNDKEIESKADAIQKQIDSLEEDLRRAKLREPTSPYANIIRFERGNTFGDDVKNEYLIIRALGSNTAPVPLSSWYIESTISGRRVSIPPAHTLFSTDTRNDTVSLKPGETAYLYSQTSPFKASFHENICTGYLKSETKLPVTLSQKCPLAYTELKDDTRVSLEDDSCYKKVSSIPRCTTPSRTDPSLSQSCISFLSTLTYQGCVDRHRLDPFFDTPSNWFLFLGKEEKLWRKEREILRLIDENNRVVGVIEY